MRKGHEIGKWMPFEIEPWLSDPDIQTWYDDQEKWYLRLLLQAWKNSANPCHLPNDQDRLMSLAGVSLQIRERVAAWKERGPAVLRKFAISEDGKWLFHPKQTEIYANQLGRLDARRDAGSKGGKQSASKRAALLQQPCSSSSISLSSSDSYSKSLEPKKENTFDSEEYVRSVMAIGFRDSTIRTKDLIARALFTEIKDLGADPDEMFKSLCRIFKWTNQGDFAKPCYKVIPEWREKQSFWERKAHVKSTGGKFSSGVEELSKYLHVPTPGTVAD